MADETTPTTTSATQTIYLYEKNSDGYFVLSDTQTIASGADLPDNATTIAPVDPSQVYWNGKNWVSELVPVYTWDENNVFDKIYLMPKGSQLGDRETYEEVPQGLYTPIMHIDQPPYWQGTDEQAWQAAHQPAAPTPTAQQELNAKIMLRATQQAAQLTEQQTAIANLMVDNAKLKSQVNVLANAIANVPNSASTSVPTSASSQSGESQSTVETSANESKSASTSESANASESTSQSESTLESQSTSTSEATSETASATDSQSTETEA